MAYPDFVQRILLQPDLLATLRARETAHIGKLLEVRELNESGLFAPEVPADPRAARLARAGLLLLLDAPAECRSVSAPMTDLPLAGYWTGIALRREGEFSLAKDAFRRAGEQPFFSDLHRRASNHCADFARQATWDPYLFTCLCEQHAFGDDSPARPLILVQGEEWRCAFEYTWRRALGA